MVPSAHYSPTGVKGHDTLTPTYAHMETYANVMGLAGSGCAQVIDLTYVAFNRYVNTRRCPFFNGHS